MKRFTAWTLYNNTKTKLDGQYREYVFNVNPRNNIPSYYRTTLRDLAEYSGGI